MISNISAIRNPESGAPTTSQQHSGHNRRRSQGIAHTASSSTSSDMLIADFVCDVELPLSTTAGASYDGEADEQTIFISSESKAAGDAVSPYLAKNIPQTYNPVGNHTISNVEPNTKYCNRHRPDVKCRRQANEESMDQLQKELNQLSSSDQQGISHVWSLFSAAPAAQRNLMLRGVLSVCCFPQLSYISSTIRDLIKVDFISLLPAELSYTILCYLDTTSLCKAAQVCRKWRGLADDDVVWHRMCEQHIDRKCTKCGWGLPMLERQRLRIAKRQIQLRMSGQSSGGRPHLTHNQKPIDENVANGAKRQIEDDTSMVDNHRKRARGSKASSSLTKQHWKDVYKARFKVGTNWKYGRCSLRILKGHQNGVMCIQFQDNILATGSYDSTVKIWDLDSGDETRTLQGHTSGVRCLQFDDVRLMSGSIDGTIRIWDWHTGECMRILSPEKGGVLSLNFGSNYLCAGTMQNVVRVWNTQDQSTFTLTGHSDFVSAIKVDSASRTVFSASDDCTVKLWDLDARKCIKTFEGHVGQVQQVLPLPFEFEFDENDLQTGDHDADTENEGDASSENGKSSDARRHEANKSPPHGSQQSRGSPPPLINTTLFPDQPDRPNPPPYMLTGALDSTIRLWHVPTGRCLRTFFGHLEGIWALAADTLRVVSGAEDSMIKVWDPKSGKCERTFTGHLGPVTCIGLSDEKLISGGEDGEIRVLEFDTDCFATKR